MAPKYSLTVLLAAGLFLTVYSPCSPAQDPAIEQSLPAEDPQAVKRKELEEHFRFLSTRLNNLPKPPEVRGKAISLAGQPAAETEEAGSEY